LPVRINPPILDRIGTTRTQVVDPAFEVLLNMSPTMVMPPALAGTTEPGICAMLLLLLITEMSMLHRIKSWPWRWAFNGTDASWEFRAAEEPRVKGENRSPAMTVRALFTVVHSPFLASDY
jgi:hypothetical protein